MTRDRKNPRNDAKDPIDALDAEIEAGAGDASRSGAALDGERLAEAEERLRAAQEEAKRSYDALLRARADFDNLKKRSARELFEESSRARGEALHALLPTLDDLDRALADESGDADALRAGVILIRENMRRRLEALGVTEIATKGERFDPEVHEAFGGIPHGEMEPGTIVQEIQKGYLLDGRVLRPARVMVAVAAAGERFEDGE
jgi:molecular chaperone GrpE